MNLFCDINLVEQCCQNVEYMIERVCIHVVFVDLLWYPYMKSYLQYLRNRCDSMRGDIFNCIFLVANNTTIFPPHYILGVVNCIYELLFCYFIFCFSSILFFLGVFNIVQFLHFHAILIGIESSLSDVFFIFFFSYRKD